MFGYLALSDRRESWVNYGKHVRVSIVRTARMIPACVTMALSLRIVLSDVVTDARQIAKLVSG